MMDAGDSKTGRESGSRARGGRAARGGRWWRRLRTLGIVVIVAITGLVAVVYAASWRVTVHVTYGAKNSSRTSVFFCGLAHGQAAVSVADPGYTALHFATGMVHFVVWPQTGDRPIIVTAVHLINLPWAVVDGIRTYSFRIEIPLAVLVATSAWLITRRMRAARAARKGSCPKCGYELTGSPRLNDGSVGVCPECGRADGGGAAT